MFRLRVRPTLSAWIGAGMLLDAVALALLWWAQGALGLGATLGGSWPLAVAFVTIPWLSHTLWLPALAGAPRPTASRAAAMTAAYVAGAALLIPALGALIVLAATAAGLFDESLWNRFGWLLDGLEPNLRRRVADILGNIALIVLWTGPVGAAVGAMGGLLRRGLYEAGAAHPPWSADAFGGFAAAVIAFLALGLAQLVGLFVDSPATQALDGLPFVYPALGTAVGLAAFLPHLVLTRPLNPPRATLACGAAQTAPSR